MRAFLRDVQGPEADELLFLDEFIGERGVKDGVWIPRAVEDGVDVIITADQGRQTKGDKLPELCEKYEITHVLLSGKLCDKGREVITFAIFSIWPKIRQAYEEPSLRFRLTTAKCHKNEVGDYRITLERAGLATGRGN